MISLVRVLPLLAAGLGSAALLCPLCDRGPALAQAESVHEQSADTATARLHISRMTCGSCPATARLALMKLPGVYRATVTLHDSLGVVSYDPGRVTPEQIAAHLSRATGFGATMLPDSTKTPGRSNGA
ncbi:MAG: heavy-metal-associated domain-containing protein [Gemmatimonadales bacterium]